MKKKQQQWNIDINSIKADFATDEQLKKRKSAADNLDIDSIFHCCCFIVSQQSSFFAHSI